MSKKRLAEEIGRLISISATEEIGDRLIVCEAEDEKRGGTCYAAGVALFNASIGMRQVGPNQFDMRDI